MIKEVRRTGSFVAVDNEGNEYTIHVYTKILDASTMGNLGAEKEGEEILITDEGLSVNRLKKGEYQIVQTGEIIYSDDPDAP